LRTPRARSQISSTERFGKVVDFLRKQIQRDSVVRARARAFRRFLIVAGVLTRQRTRSARVRSQFVYLKSAFTPSLDDEVQSLFEARACAHAAAPRAWHTNPIFRLRSRVSSFASASLTRHASARTGLRRGGQARAALRLHARVGLSRFN
jgi:hypothetical protein